ncbi:lipoprotein signal peptidase [Dokdonia sinensis]|uniref:Lipoprotein signal peptidase n=1 Tax=Dokdonia sinensis TaxID=2479847 RepID=A0A3M0GG26_9FLAO|nr:lipoprotein signal peptidase [Dokdonia sinensis]RMB63248.1 lipoprotein signal peptidase [Dokdonia sinensis]
MSFKKATIIVFLILLVDQISKVYIKTNFLLGESIQAFGLDWFEIRFVENEGAAWGTRLPGEYGKLILSLFRLAISPIIGYWLYKSAKENAPKLLIVAIALIFAGAVGNIIDSLLYGVLFDESTPSQVATFLPENGGYASPLYGNVVDMLYFPIWEGILPSWIPVWGGKSFTFFNAIFNIADMAISTGVGILLVFNKKVFPKTKPAEQEVEA